MGKTSSPLFHGQPPALSSQVRCAGCGIVLSVAHGVMQFSCPTCKLPQELPPVLIRPQFQQSPLPLQMLPPPQRPLSLQPVQTHGIDPTKIQLPCAHCKAILNVPHGLSRFSCPQCRIDLAVDVSKLNQYMEPPEEVNEVAIDVEREEDEGGMVGETFTDYRPLKVSFGPPHPDPVVETSSLSAVQPPEPTYDLKIRDSLESSKALSCLQIETIVYACQRHLQNLDIGGPRAGFFIGDGAGVGKGRTIAGLIWENWLHGRRRTLWISVAADLIYDAQRDLNDVGASCIQVHPLNKKSYSKLDSGKEAVKEGIVFLTYSSLIASSEKGRSRMKQLLQWCGPEYEGLVVFDECHKAKNLIPEAGSQPTRTGEAVLELQARLPGARVVYSSATGASEPRNMGYMVRLGLWGAGTCFNDFHFFLAALDKGGVGALELVAMDMKARGMYVCRTLSYKGSEFEVVEAALEEKMMDLYTKAAEVWASIRMEILLAIEFFKEEEKPNLSQLWRLYWASHQRFFRHVCMSAKVPAAVRLAKQALIENKCVVIGLQSTGEARTEEAVTKHLSSEQGPEMDDFVSGPRELLLKFVEENYPLPPKPEALSGIGDDGDKELQRKRRSTNPGVSFKGHKVAKCNPSDPRSDDDSQSESDQESTTSDEEFQICGICSDEEERKNLLRCSICAQRFHSSCLTPPITDVVAEDWSCHLCKQTTDKFLQETAVWIAKVTKRYEAAVERKTTILNIIKSLDLPNNPLDDIIDQLGGPDNVAEITGRRGMLVRASNGERIIYQRRNTKEIAMDMVNMHEKQLFMDGKKLVAIISEAGSAGISLQADRRVLNQKRRVHLTLELPWSADRAIQQFGRTHRSNQASAPEYRLLFTNLGGERRFASIVAKRLESLGALTQGDRRAGPSLSAYNYDSGYGKRALMTMYRGILEQETLPVSPPGCSSDKPDAIKDFLIQAKAALVSVGIVKDTPTGDRGKFVSRVVDSDMHDVGRFLNRILGLAPDIQNRLFELFVSILDLYVQNARTEGNFDTGIVDIRANTIELQGKPKTVHVDHMSGAFTLLFTLTLDRGFTWESARTLLDEKQKGGLDSISDGFYESKREWMGRRHFILAIEGSTSGAYKIFRPAVGEAMREMPLSELKSKYRKIASVDKACTGWEDEYEVSSKQCMHGPKCKLESYCTVGRRLQEVNVLGGLILPVWGKIEEALSKQARQSHKRLRIVRVETTTDNQRIVGLLVPNSAVEAVLQGLQWVHEIED